MSSAPESDSRRPPFITSTQVRKARYGGRSKNWLVRRIADHGFPPAINFGGKDNFHSVPAMDDWDRAMIDKATSHRVPSRKLTDARRGAVEAGLAVERQFKR